ncbi:YidB family protein [Asaia spathodeae]|uniref:YidB family protein n=1 Tax=Asaia spathodeae TaxID=657016 RepID=UPI0038CF9FA8
MKSPGRARNGRQGLSGFFGSMINSALGSMGDKLRERLGGGLGEYLTSEQGLQMLIDQARKAGLEDKVRSWIGSGENLPISADELRALLTDEQIQMLVSKTGLPAGALLPALAQFLPGVVDQHTSEQNGTPSAS